MSDKRLYEDISESGQEGWEYRRDTERDRFHDLYEHAELIPDNLKRWAFGFSYCDAIACEGFKLIANVSSWMYEVCGRKELCGPCFLSVFNHTCPEETRSGWLESMLAMKDLYGDA